MPAVCKGGDFDFYGFDEVKRDPHLPKAERKWSTRREPRRAAPMHLPAWDSGEDRRAEMQ